jgi:hypothetical protein
MIILQPKMQIQNQNAKPEIETPFPKSYKVGEPAKSKRVSLLK